MRSRSSPPFPIVGIGASAGGIDAFRRLLRPLPNNTGMAFVFIQHLSRDNPSLLQTILSKSTLMPVSEVRQGTRVQPNHVYVIPPNTRMIISRKVLCLRPRAALPAMGWPIDEFFRSLADDLGEQAIGVVLSGSASDGAVGLKAIREAGGITFVQSEASSTFMEMPHNAVAAGGADKILPPAQIARELARIAHHSYLAEAHGKPDDETLFQEAQVHKVIELVRMAAGIDFRHYRQTTLHRRLWRRMALLKMNSLADYLQRLRRNPGEALAMSEDMLIHTTGFFRDPKAFEALERWVFPTLFSRRPKDQPIRIWVAGCSTGQEIYSLAIALTEFQVRRHRAVPLRIFASDVNDTSIQKARRGTYTPSEMSGVSPQRLQGYFSKIEGGYQIAKAIRKQCVFAKQDILHDPPYSNMDLISCRNVLIYLEPVWQKQALSHFHYALKRDGILLLGPAETPSPLFRPLAAVDEKHRIYAKNPPLGKGYPAWTYPPREVPWRQALPAAGEKKRTAHAREDVEKLLQSSQSSNEELQSTNEELETAKEELQSSNEELITLSEEVQVRNTELSRLNDDLNNILTSVHIPLLMIGDDRRLRRATAAAAIFGIVPADLGKPIAECPHHLPVPDLDDILERIPRMIAPLEREVQDVEKNWYLLQIHPYRTLDDQVTGAVLTFLDIDARKRSEARLQESRDFALSIVEAVREPLVVLKADLRVKTANRSFYDHFKLADEEVGGRLFGELARGLWDNPELLALLRSVFVSKAPIVNFCMERDGLELGHLSFIVNARLLARPAAPPELIVSIQDVTQSRKLQEMLILSGKMSAVGKLAAGIAHELNNPLTVILGSVQSELRQSQSPSTELPHILRSIEREAARCSHLVKELLTFSRARPIGKVLQSPAALLHQALALVAAQAKMHQVKLLQTIEPKLPPIRIDSDQFSQIVLNLCTNAIDAMPKGGVLTVALTRQGTMIELRVQDSGEGIPPEVRSRIFDPFFTTKELGKGLGLSLAHDIIKNHSGTIEVDSEIGQGTAFLVRLPISPPEPVSV